MIKGMKPFFLFLVCVLTVFLAPQFVSAGTAHNLSGYAWSSNIGWISFNCTNTNTCASVDYGVHQNASGYFTGNEAASVPGYAWSPNVGWIQFGGLSGFPTGSGTYAQNVQVVGGELRGWARALSHGGGWDGWISFSGTTPGYGITPTGNTFTGYAWGSTVIGWLTFNPTLGTGVTRTGGDPAAFTLGADENIRIQTLSNGTADSETKYVSVETNLAFQTAANPVTITLLSYPTVASTTFMYSFDGGSNYYAAGSPSLTRTINSPYSQSLAFRVRITRLSGAPSLTSPASVIVLRGLDSVGGTSATKNLTISPVLFDPRYEEF